MVRRSVALTVPAIGIVSPQQAADMLESSIGGPLVAVEQEFAGGPSGRALLVFPKDHWDKLFRTVMAEEAPPADEAMLHDAMRETGNVLLQGCLGSIGNLLERSLSISVPRVVSGRAAELIAAPTEGVVVFVYVNFDVEGGEIRGYLALVLDFASLEQLRALVGDFIKRVT